jgi:hypothetical protein
MSLSYILLEKDFETSRDGLTYKVKATAVFLVHQLPPEVGKWHVNFDVRTGQLTAYAPDQRLISKAAAQRAAEQAFDSGEVEQFIEANLKTWIIIGAIDPVLRR